MNAVVALTQALKNEDVQATDQQWAELRKVLPPFVVFDTSLFEQQPCYLCGFSGIGYWNSGVHSCAKYWHQYKEAGKSKPT